MIKSKKRNAVVIKTDGVSWEVLTEITENLESGHDVMLDIKTQNMNRELKLQSIYAENLRDKYGAKLLQLFIEHDEAELPCWSLKIK